jgi:hypothetical protein
MARVSCIRKPRYAEPRFPDLRLFGILCHVFWLKSMARISFLHARV